MTLITPDPHPNYRVFIDLEGIVCLSVPCAPDAAGNTSAVHAIGTEIARGLAAQLNEAAEKGKT